MESDLEDEERLIQMVQDFIESSSSPSSSTISSWAAANHGSFFSSSPSDDDRHSKYLACFLREILEEKETGAEADVLESVMKLMRRRRMRRKKGSSSSSRNCSTGLRKWLVLGLQMEGYLASLCQTSWVTSSGCPGGNYEYIDILILEDDEQREHLHHRLIVDIDFKSQFEVARPTPTYEELTDILPAVFVGSESKLNRIISILCSAAEQSLRERGLHIPPWRTATYLHSKWLSPPHTAKCHFISRPPPPPSSSSSDRNNDEDNNDGDCDGDQKIVKSSNMLWAPPPAPTPTPISNGSTVGVKGKRRSLRGGSALSSQFSNMSINCC